MKPDDCSHVSLDRQTVFVHKSMKVSKNSSFGSIEQIQLLSSFCFLLHTQFCKQEAKQEQKLNTKRRCLFRVFEFAAIKFHSFPTRYIEV